MGYEFNAEKVTKDLIVWVRKFYADFDLDKKAVLGISGGKDSTVAAKILCEALGKDRVVGVSIPNGTQSDMHDVAKVFELLGIKRYTVNIADAYLNLTGQVADQDLSLTSQCYENLPPRLRMSTIYLVAQAVNGLVCCTGNLSESFVGWTSKWGDNVGDFALFEKLTKTEVCEIGLHLGLPEDLVNKVPSDGLCGRSDEDKFGFSYDVLDTYIRTWECKDQIAKMKIDYMHSISLHKRCISMPTFSYN